MADPAHPEVTIWTDEARTPMAAELLDMMGSSVVPIGVGGPRASAVDGLARSLDCPREDDLRKLVVEHPAAFVLLASALQTGVHDALAAVNPDSVILTLEPVAADLTEWAPFQSTPRRIVDVPAFTQSPGFLSAAMPHETLGPRRMIRFTNCGPAGNCSLFARLLDSWCSVLGFADMPESIDASLIGPYADVPEDLRRMTGCLGAHARMPGGCCAVLELTDRAAHRHRALHVVGQAGEVRITDTGYDLHHLDGTRVDHGDESPEPVTGTALIAAQWHRLLDRPHLGAGTDGRGGGNALACCLTCLLSARTGQPENPQRIIEMNR